MITNLDHITIILADKARSIWFYSDILKLPFINIVKMSDHELIYFYLNAVTRLELIEYYHSEDKVKTSPLNVGSYRHMALVTDNIQLLYNVCIDNNIEVTMKPQYLELLHCIAMLITDPNGVEIEIIQKK
ncbi:MAG: VOC family protein [Herbinix sp.]|nr:VOC family protein [Herbinix sp.]